MKGKSYLQIGSQCMGIGSSIADHAFMEDYLGLRVESVDEVRFSAVWKREYMTRKNIKKHSLGLKNTVKRVETITLNQ